MGQADASSGDADQGQDVAVVDRGPQDTRKPDRAPVDQTAADQAAADLPPADVSGPDVIVADQSIPDTHLPDMSLPDMSLPDSLGPDVGCGPGLTWCQGSCVDLATDFEHCGSCERSCSGATADQCVGGDCVCGNNDAECQNGLDCLFLSCLCVANGQCSGCCRDDNSCLELSSQTATFCGNNGAACQACDDGLSCTAPQCSDVGSCLFVHIPFFCLIEEQCYNHGEYRTSQQCWICDISTPEGRVSWTAAANPGCVTTLAGTGEEGVANGDAKDAQFSYPFKVALDPSAAGGTRVIVTDRENHRIRIIQNGAVSTLAGGDPGFADGPNANAEFATPYGLAVAADGTVYVADTGNHRIRVIAGGTVSTLAGNGNPDLVDGTGPTASFYAPYDLALDEINELLYVADRENHAIRRVEIPTGQVSTVAGDGTPGDSDGALSSARFNIPHGVFYRDGHIFVADFGNHRIRDVALSAGAVTTVAGSTLGYRDGAVASAQFNGPCDVAVMNTGSANIDGIYVADLYNHRIRRVNNGQVTTAAGSGQTDLVNGTMASAGFHAPSGLVFQGGGSGPRFFVADSYHHCVRTLNF